MIRLADELSVSEVERFGINIMTARIGGLVIAYGADGVAQIPPAATLVFEVELVKVEKVKGHEGMMGGMGRMMNPHK